jgi:hypothetical protein
LPWQFNLDAVAGSNITAVPDHSEHPRTKLHFSIFHDHCALQALLKTVDVDARRPQAGQLDDGTRSKMQTACQRKPEKIEISRCNVLAEFPGRTTKPSAFNSEKNSHWIRWI